ncbi:MAG: CBS domain-containing protein, partial [Acidimicrobiales bacterium]
IALAGPAVSGALAAGCGLLAGAAAAAGAADLATATLAWLALTNAILAGFNLLPAFPLDGGRVYQALQWRRSGSYVDATRKAAALGRVVANGLIALGVVEIALGAAGSGLWMLMIGWFVRAAGRAEADTAEARAVFGDRPVSSIMTPRPVTAPAAISVAELVERYVLGARHSAYPVVDADGAPVGLVTLEHVRRIPVDERARRRVDEAAAPLRAVLVVGPDDSAAELSMLLSRAPGGRALVVAEGRVVGIVTARDVLGAWAAGAGSATGPAGPVAADGAPPMSDVSAKLGR